MSAVSACGHVTSPGEEIDTEALLTAWGAPTEAHLSLASEIESPDRELLDRGWQLQKDSCRKIKGYALPPLSS
jgi:hypothetical protein